MSICKFVCVCYEKNVAQNQYYNKKNYNVWIIITIAQQCVYTGHITRRYHTS
jgi:hypothetical protein